MSLCCQDCFISNRNGTFQIFRAERSALGLPFSSLVAMTEFEVQDAVLDYPSVTSDASEFYFTRDYGQGRDIYRATNLVDPNVDPNAMAGDYMSMLLQVVTLTVV